MILVAIIRTRSLCGYRYLHRPSTVTQSRSRPISAIRVHMYVPHTHSLRNHLPFPHPSSYLRTYPMPRTLSIQIHHITHLFRDSNHSIVLPPPLPQAGNCPLVSRIHPQHPIAHSNQSCPERILWGYVQITIPCFSDRLQGRICVLIRITSSCVPLIQVMYPPHEPSH